MSFGYAHYAQAGLDRAFSTLGVTYGLGGNGKTKSGLDENGNLIQGRSIDCSGITQLAYPQLAHYAAFQLWEVAHVFAAGIDYLRQGDLVFWYKNNSKRGPQGQPYGADHVGIFLGWRYGYRWVYQAVTFGQGSAVTPMQAYASPFAFGRVRIGNDWHKSTTKKSLYLGRGLTDADLAKWRARGWSNLPAHV